MKYPCCLIQDLLPLFHDGVCSDGTAEIVRGHLAECEACRGEYERISAAENVDLPAPADEAEELKKAASLSRVKRKMSRKNRLLMIVAAALLIALVAVGYMWNEHGEFPLPYQESMHAYFEEEGDLVLQGDLPCSVVHISQILVPAEVHGKVENHVFLRYYCKPLDYLLCRLFGNGTDSVYVVAFAEKGAQDIDAIHYITADFHSGWFSGNSAADPLPMQQLLQRINASVTIWEKE